ncbi:hypothetical protein HBE96_16135 [Clostridium sp. P21]|uniref:Uncharacterized protein n=1 Tax=Clostridium muellerianum TaxID=2716538 RepID=A0A7Y0HQU1_9CLOT|nr:hypothetical protein [Clostridium muellerianum]NMM64158.1 hypothetical protein [Clostridium muellerianum]
MENYRGYKITVIENGEKDYPFKAIARKEDKEIKHKGQTKTQAVDLVKNSINVIMERTQMKASVK